MKVKLTLTGGEFDGLMKISAWLTKVDSAGDFALYCYVDALEDFVVKHAGRFIKPQVRYKSNKVRITLTDMQTLAFHFLLNIALKYKTFKSFEEVLALKIIGDIDRQFEAEKQLRMAVMNVKN